MLGFIWRQLRGRAGRSVALVIGVLVATTGFVVLTGATTTSRLEVTGAVERNTRAAYDILVRPKGTRTTLEMERGLVRSNYLSGLFGGITKAQYEQISQIPDVDVAAPISMLGYSTSPVPIRFDLTDAVDRTLERQVIRIDRTFVAERGLSTAPGRPRYVYVTKHPLIYPVAQPDFDPNSAVREYSDGRTYQYDEDCGDVPREVLPDGSSIPICEPQSAVHTGSWSASTERELWSFETVRLRPDGRFDDGYDRFHRNGGLPTATDRLVTTHQVTVPLLLAAVDPDAEQRLVGLGDSVTEGRMIRGDETVAEGSFGRGSITRTVPVLSTSRPYLDGAVRGTFTRLPGVRPAGVPVEALERTVNQAVGVRAGSGEYTLTNGYRDRLAEGISDTGCCFGQLSTIMQAGAPEYERLPDGTLRVRATPPLDPEVYSDGSDLNPLPRPWLADDTGTRPVHPLLRPRADGALVSRDWRAVGIFDPEKLTGFDELTRVPLETYEPPRADGADDRSRRALGDRPLEPSGNPAGYLSAPPLLLTTLAAVPDLLQDDPTSTQRTAPISAIRVRVTDVAGYTERSAERVRLIAERIVASTGLDVDLTFGSSPAPQTVELPGGAFGRPDLRLTEQWSALGVATVIIQAVDRKSVALFLLVLVVCALFLANAVSAAVRDRRTELAVLSCLGWPARRIGALILGEVTALGLAAGLLALAAAVPLGAVLGVEVTWWQAALAVPVGLVLSVAAGAVPALRAAARAHPAGALRPQVTSAHRGHRPGTLIGLALVNVSRTPGRTLLGAGALAIGVAALTLVNATAYTFRGAVVGSLLGDSVSLSVRGADTVAAVATVLLGAAAVADVLYLNIRDRAVELATLRAIGWTDAALGRLIGYEGLLLGVLGAVCGAALGLGGAAWLVGDLPAALVLVASVTALVGVLVTCVAALVPGALLRRLPTAQLLAEE